jgi:hypothetical protein
MAVLPLVAVSAAWVDNGVVVNHLEGRTIKVLDHFAADPRGGMTDRRAVQARNKIDKVRD